MVDIQYFDSKRYGRDNLIRGLEKICDVIPLVSTITNLVELFFRCFILPCLGQEAIDSNRFYSIIQGKSVVRSAIFLIPILGNIAAFILHCHCPQEEISSEDQTKWREEFELGPQTSPEWVAESRERVLADLVQKAEAEGIIDNPEETEMLKPVEDFLIEQVGEPGVVDIMMAYAGYRLSDEEKAFLSEVTKNGAFLQWGTPAMRANFNIVKAAVQEFGFALYYADDSLKDDDGIVRIATEIYPKAFKYASERLRGDFDTVKAIVQEFPWCLEYATDALKDNDEIVGCALGAQYRNVSDRTFQRYRSVLFFASPRLQERLHN